MLERRVGDVEGLLGRKAECKRRRTKGGNGAWGKRVACSRRVSLKQGRKNGGSKTNQL